MKKIIKQDQINVPEQISKMDFQKMSKKQLVNAMEQFVMPMANPEKYKELVKASVPALVKEMDTKEDLGTAMKQASQEMMLAVVETLRKYNNFTDGQISQFLLDLRGNLNVVEKVEEAGLSMLSDHSMRHIVDMVHETGVDKMLAKIAETRFKKEQTWRTGLEYPNYLEGSRMERKLQKPRK